MTGTHQTHTTTEATETVTSEGNSETDTRNPTDEDDKSDVFDDLPPSAKLVHFVIDRDGDLTQTDLVDETSLSARTVRTALSRLEDAGLVTESICLRDARKRVYALTDDGADVGDASDIEANA